MRARIDSEEKVAALVVSWMRDEGWDVYQEVAITTGGDRADIVGVRGPVLHVVRLGLGVIAAPPEHELAAVAQTSLDLEARP